MNLSREKKTGIIFICALLLIVSGFFYFGTNLFTHRNKLYIIFNNIYGLSLDAPVYIKDIKVGKVENMYFAADSSCRIVVILSLKTTVNIPDKSVAEIITINKKTGDKAIKISLVTSPTCLLSGDTIRSSEISISIDTLLKVSNKISAFLKDTVILNKYEKEIIKPEIIYKVQLYTSIKKIPVTSHKFKNLKGVQVYFHNGIYKYTVGNEKTLDKAALIKIKIHNKGFEDAFIIAFYKDKRISVKKAIELARMIH